MSIDAQGIHLFGLYIRFYALFILTGAMLAAWLVARRAPAFGLDPNHVWDGLFWALIPGLIGARIYHVLTPSPSLGLNYYRDNPLQIFAIWNGGLGIYGAIIGGMLGIWYYTHRHQQPLLKWLDLAAPALAIAQAIGRWGNLVNQELYGAPTDVPWAVYISPEKRVAGYTQYERFHPLFLYESLWNLAAAFILIWLHHRLRHWLKDGDILLLYLMQYAVIRFLLDFVRLDSNGFGPLTTAQVVSLVAFFASIFIFIAHHRTAKTTNAT